MLQAARLDGYRPFLTRGNELCEPCCSTSPAAGGGFGRTGRKATAPRAARSGWAVLRRAQSTRLTLAASLFFDRPTLNPAKLDVTFLPSAQNWSGPLPAQRRYTLTHNDITGSLQLSVGAGFNHRQLSNWYLRLLRDEVLAEWEFGGGGPSTLHVYCHVSGEQFWLASPALRKFIFEKEMPLVLDTIRYGDRPLLSSLPELQNARVLVHFRSHLPQLHAVTDWGQLGNDATWPVTEQGPALWRLLQQYLSDKLDVVEVLPRAAAQRVEVSDKVKVKV